MIFTATIPPPAVDVTQFVGRLLHESTDAVREAVPGDLHAYEGPGVSKYGLARARNDGPSNPLYRMGALFAAMRRAGRDRAEALALIERQQAWVEVLWSDERADLDAMLHAQAVADAAENVAESAYRIARQRGVQARVRAEARRYDAALGRAISAYRALRAAIRQEITP
jgi:hypothetical protein